MYEKSIDLLNKAVADKLSTIHQYQYFRFRCDDQGLDMLEGLFKNTAMAEIHHVEKLSERILSLNGDVDMNSSTEINKIKSVKEMLELAREMEKGSMKDHYLHAHECASIADVVTKQLFEKLVSDEEKHFRQYETELENIKKFGDSYLALQSVERSNNR